MKWDEVSRLANGFNYTRFYYFTSLECSWIFLSNFHLRSKKYFFSYAFNLFSISLRCQYFSAKRKPHSKAFVLQAIVNCMAFLLDTLFLNTESPKVEIKKRSIVVFLTWHDSFFFFNSNQNYWKVWILTGTFTIILETRGILVLSSSLCQPAVKKSSHWN